MADSSDSRWKPAIWIADAHAMTQRTAALLALGWIVTTVAARVGLPPIDRHSELQPRPLETFGVLTLCIPASLHVLLLRDELPWLAAVSPRSLRLSRLAWVGSVTAHACLVALIWTTTLDPRVPRGHTFLVWLLLDGCAIISLTVIRNDLPVVLPLIVAVAFTTPHLIPFDHNLLYNDRLTHPLTIWAFGTVLLGMTIYIARGDRRAEPSA